MSKIYFTVLLVLLFLQANGNQKFEAGNEYNCLTVPTYQYQPGFSNGILSVDWQLQNIEEAQQSIRQFFNQLNSTELKSNKFFFIYNQNSHSLGLQQPRKENINELSLIKIEGNNTLYSMVCFKNSFKFEVENSSQTVTIKFSNNNQTKNKTQDEDFDKKSTSFINQTNANNNTVNNKTKNETQEEIFNKNTSSINNKTNTNNNTESDMNSQNSTNNIKPEKFNIKDWTCYNLQGCGYPDKGADSPFFGYQFIGWSVSNLTAAKEVLLERYDQYVKSNVTIPERQEFSYNTQTQLVAIVQERRAFNNFTLSCSSFNQSLFSIVCSDPSSQKINLKVNQKEETVFIDYSSSQQFIEKQQQQFEVLIE